MEEETSRNFLYASVLALKNICADCCLLMCAVTEGETIAGRRVQARRRYADGDGAVPETDPAPHEAAGSASKGEAQAHWRRDRPQRPGLRRARPDDLQREGPENWKAGTDLRILGGKRKARHALNT